MKPLLAMTVMLAMAATSAGQAPSTRPALPTSAPATQPGSRVLIWQVIHDTDYTRPQPERLLVVLNVRPDPALHLAYLPTVVRAEKAEDDQGHSLVFTGDIPADLSPDMTAYMSKTAMIRLILMPPAANLTIGKTMSFAGAIPAVVAGKTDTISLAVPQKQTREYGGVKATLQTMMVDDRTVRVNVNCDFPTRLPAELRRDWINRMTAVRIAASSADGGAWPEVNGVGGRSWSDRQTSLTQHFSAPPGAAAAGPPAKVSVEMVTETKTTPIPFRMENVPLP